ncbi:hypothetical protein IHQ11_13310 [Priestia megaterium]|uniref:hypothetical protein n=1 Tax=Priestia megaterium TaxID=1404 RepID=UPI001B3A1008|nr:hypothetical protein [Priestia megaterium]MBQ4867477.1 hypothetical protein [Priestia megaterium]
MTTITLAHEGTEFNQITANGENAVYYNAEFNNLIIVRTDAIDDETLNKNDDTIEDVFGYLVGERFDDFCASAEYFRNSTILVHKPWHTTTDFVANYDLNPKTLLSSNRSVKGFIRAFNKACPELVPFKLIEIMGGKAYRYGEIPEDVFEAYDEGNQ